MSDAAKDPLDHWRSTSKDVADFFGISFDHVKRTPQKYLGSKVGGRWHFNIARILHRGDVIASRRAK